MKRPTTIRLTPELEEATERYTADNETNLAQLTRLALRRFLETEGYWPEGSVRSLASGEPAPAARSRGPGER